MSDSKKTKTPSRYKVVLKVLGKRWEAQGSSLLKALENLKPTWEKIKGKGTLAIYVSGNKKHEHLFVMPIIRGILSNKIVRQTWAKNLTFLIKEGNKTNIPK